MEYIFSRDDQTGNETLRTKGETHTDLKGFCDAVSEYDDSTITDSFFVLEKYHSEEDSEGMCYDWYTIEKHNRTIDRTKTALQAAEQLEKQVTDAQLALADLYESMAQAAAQMEKSVTDAQLALTELYEAR